MGVGTANVRERDVRAVGVAHESDAGVRLRGQDADEGVGVAVEGDGGGGLQLLAVEGGEDANEVVGAGGRAHDGGGLVDHLQELANHKRYRLDQKGEGVRGERGRKGGREGGGGGEQRGVSGPYRQSYGNGIRYLDPLDLFLGVEELAVQGFLFLPDIFLLNFDELELRLESLQPVVYKQPWEKRIGS